MSVTGHNPVRRADDYYATPAWCTLAILRHLPLRPKQRAFDPCAGDGAILRAIRSLYPMSVEIDGIELDEGRAKAAGVRQGDALAIEDWGKPDLVLTNPPFSASMQFVEASLARVAVGGTVAMLLRRKNGRSMTRYSPSPVFFVALSPLVSASVMRPPSCSRRP